MRVAGRARVVGGRRPRACPRRRRHGRVHHGRRVRQDRPGLPVGGRWHRPASPRRRPATRGLGPRGRCRPAGVRGRRRRPAGPGHRRCGRARPDGRWLPPDRRGPPADGCRVRVGRWGLPVGVRWVRLDRRGLPVGVRWVRLDRRGPRVGGCRMRWGRSGLPVGGRWSRPASPGCLRCGRDCPPRRPPAGCGAGSGGPLADAGPAPPVAVIRRRPPASCSGSATGRGHRRGLPRAPRPALRVAGRRRPCRLCPHSALPRRRRRADPGPVAAPCGARGRRGSGRRGRGPTNRRGPGRPGGAVAVGWRRSASFLHDGRPRLPRRRCPSDPGSFGVSVGKH
jgi:hypothetical protein